ncbi:hypothetical protein [Streptomyces sp. B21-083]|uniref:hypothetical protein n=1 Tax=Streptomyces sp. B21-083 TaxID=3039410 RepID=UPI002FF02E63
MRRPARVVMGVFQTLLVASFVVLPARSAHAADANFYVDPSGGSDSNSGTSTTSAFKTIEKARNAVRTVNSAMSGDIVVNLRGGTYPLTSPVDFTTADSGRPSSDIPCVRRRPLDSRQLSCRSDGDVVMTSALP